MLFISELNAIEVIAQDTSPIKETIAVETSQNYATVIDDPYLDELAKDTWFYISSDWATSNHLPWSWRSETITGGDYANTAEIGMYALSWVIAYDMQEVWSPNWAQTESEVISVLDQLRAWQTGSQSEQPNGVNAYNSSVFYQWYHVSPTPPVVGPSSGDHLVPSIDNAWLAASLITIREYGKTNNHPQLAQKADLILQDMDFSLWYHPDTHRFSWGAFEDPQGGTQADYFSNENRLINFIARSMGHISQVEFLNSLDALQKPPGTYDGITVENISWDGSFFTYGSPALFIREMELDYGTETIIPAVQTQMAYAEHKGYDAWGLSDSFDVDDGEYVQQGAPPAATPNDTETRHGLVSPHASALALITPHTSDVIANLQTLSSTHTCVYDADYGFRDSVMTKPSAPDYGHCSERFSVLNQEWIFLALANNKNGFIWEYFYQDPGVQNAHREYSNQFLVYLPIIFTPPPPPATPPIIVADFDTCKNVNNLGGLMGAAYNSPDFMEESFIGIQDRGCAAKLDYDITYWAAFWLKLMSSDLTDHSTLSFDIRADLPHVPSEIKLELKRNCINNNCSEVSILYVHGITSAWNNITVDLDDFGPTGFPGVLPISTWSKIEELVFTFESSGAGSEGVVYLDNITFEP